jgi:hypothetical protein
MSLPGFGSPPLATAGTRIGELVLKIRAQNISQAQSVFIHFVLILFPLCVRPLSVAAVLGLSY